MDVEMADHCCIGCSAREYFRSWTLNRARSTFSALITRTIALLGLCSVSALAQEPPSAPAPSVVYEIADPNSVRQYRTDATAVRAMVDRLVLAVTGQPDIAKAWSSLVKPTDK